MSSKKSNQLPMQAFYEGLFSELVNGKLKVFLDATFT